VYNEAMEAAIPKVPKSRFDAVLGTLLKAPSLPLADMSTRRKAAKPVKAKRR
jgi:hypothetical protein